MSKSPTAPKPIDRRTPRCVRRSAGFTLLEIVLAVSILAIGLALAMRTATDSMRQSRQAAELTEVALHAQNLFDSLGLEEPLEPGESSGEFEDTPYRWQLIVSEHEPEGEGVPLGTEGLSAGVELLSLELVVSWDRGERPREVTFRTLRAMMPQGMR